MLTLTHALLELISRGMIRNFVECVLENPAELQDIQNDYPPAPQRVAVTLSVLSDKRVELARENTRVFQRKA